MAIQKHLKKHAANLAIESLNRLNLPNTMLIIPDGNGRWAKKMGLSVSEGHKQGGKTMSEILKHFLKINIDVLGIWGFSEDNWKRDKQETDKIMAVIKNTLDENLDFILKNDIKFFVLGKRDRLKNEYPELLKDIESAEEKTINNKGKKLVLFIDYGERFQLEEFAKIRNENPGLPTYEAVSKINNGLPLIDMVLRTSGEKRMSGFGPLATLAEFVSVDNNLPDLTDNDIVTSLKEFSGRQRRFGGRVKTFS